MTARVCRMLKEVMLAAYRPYMQAMKGMAVHLRFIM